jgi:hypothetical protein
MTLAGLAAAPSFAASDHGQTGTVIDPCAGGGWYTSTNARTKAGTGLVKLEFSKLNSKGVDWELVGKSYQLYGVEQEWTPNENGIWRTLDSSMKNGTTFFNQFEDHDQSDCNHGSYNFTGTEYY